MYLPIYMIMFLEEETLEQTIISTVEGGQMPKDLAILIDPSHEWLDTEQFMNALDENLQRNLAEQR